MPTKDPCRPGEMRHLVTWEAPTGNLNEMNEPDGTFTTLATRYAKIVATTSIERLNEQPQAQNTFVITQRFLPDLDGSCRMSYRGKTYQITGIVNVNLLDIWHIVTVVDASLGGYS